MSENDFSTKAREYRDASLRRLTRQLNNRGWKDGMPLTDQELAVVDECEALNQRVADYERRAEADAGAAALSARIGDPTTRRGSGKVAPEHRASRFAPLRFKERDMRRMHAALQAGESCSISADLETRAFFSPDSMLPASLYPWPIQQIEHEPRLADKFPGYATQAPSIEFVQHTGTTGASG